MCVNSPYSYCEYVPEAEQIHFVRLFIHALWHVVPTISITSKKLAQIFYFCQFEFVYMDMENGPRQIGGACGADWLVLYDGKYDTDPLIGGQK